MSRSLVLAGFAGSFVLAALAVAQAQEANAPQPQAAPSSCSGFGCLFGSRDAAPAPQPAAQAPVDPRAVTLANSPDPEDPIKGGAKATAKPKAKPVHVVTIAAGASELDRVKDLAAALPKEKIKIVKAADSAAPPKADFVVTTSLDRNERAEKARLFTEQMHIIAAGSIHSVADLKDKVVSFGPDKSDSQIAGRKALSVLDISVKETTLDVDNALDGLATGDIDAVILLAPQPVDRLKSVSAPGLHLISWPDDAAVPEGATNATIQGDRYPGLAKPGETIRAVGVDAVLSVNEKAARQPATKAFLSALTQKADTLSKRGFNLIKADLADRSGRKVADAARH